MNINIFLQILATAFFSFALIQDFRDKREHAVFLILVAIYLVLVAKLVP